MERTKCVTDNWIGGPKELCDREACQYWHIGYNDCGYELWVNVPEYKEVLQVSSHGRVRVIEDRFSYPDMRPIKACRLLNPIELNQDYLGVSFDGKSFFIHQLVANGFIPNPDNKRLIVHKDRNRHHNHAGNIEWKTNSERAKEAIKDGDMPIPPGYKGLIIECIETEEIFYGVNETAKKLGVPLSKLETAVYQNKSLNGKHYRILHNYSLQKQLRPELFEEG
jgi:hypothetical protein